MFQIVISFLLFCLCLDMAPVAYAIEPLNGDLSRQISELQSSMKMLQSTLGDLRETVESQNEVIQKQALRLNALEGNTPQVTPVSMGPVASKGVQGFNPDIGVTGTVQAKSTQNTSDEEGNDTIALKELELNFAHVVDPFSRLDAIISFNDNIEAQNVDIEEAYYTRWGLPLGFTAQLGKFRSKIGKQNLQHLHQLDTTDYAWVIRDFFGEDGLASSGVRLQNDIPNPLDIPLEITGEVLRGNNGPSFSGISRRPIFNTHLKTYFDMTRDANVELGWTTLFGDENPPRFESVDDGTGSGTLVDTAVTRTKGSDRYGVKVFGGDATFNWFLPEGKKLKLQNELYFQNRGNLVHVNSDPWGFYTLLDYRFSTSFSTGIRFDYLEPLDVIGEHRQSTGISPYITFWQSEFADFKLQYSHLEPANGNAKTDNIVMLQADFLAGAHKHPVQ